MIRIKSDKIVVDDKVIPGYVYINEGKIVEISNKCSDADEEYDFTGSYVSAGFIDMHTHGAVGESFVSADVDGIIRACNYHMTHGTTTIVPTMSTAEIREMAQGAQRIIEAKNSGLASCCILGVHFEGPYFNPEQCGAQNLSYITPPIESDYMEIIERFGKDIIRWDYAPEFDEGGKFAKALREHGIIASAGHTGATYKDMQVAMAEGCKLITHLYSCTSTITRNKGFRRLGVIETAFLHDDVYAEIIADGKHLPPELIRMIIKIKGTDKVAMVTDSLGIAGVQVAEGGAVEDGRYIVEDGVCKLPDRSAFAGSIATTDRLLRTAVIECGIEVPVAVKMLTRIPAEILNIDKGRLAPGADADVVVFDGSMTVTDVFVSGIKTV